jgi:hypothetical protein
MSSLPSHLHPGAKFYRAVYGREVLSDDAGHIYVVGHHPTQHKHDSGDFSRYGAMYFFVVCLGLRYKRNESVIYLNPIPLRTKENTI